MILAVGETCSHVSALCPRGANLPPWWRICWREALLLYVKARILHLLERNPGPLKGWGLILLNDPIYPVLSKRRVSRSEVRRIQLVHLREGQS